MLFLQAIVTCGLAFSNLQYIFFHPTWSLSTIGSSR
jgi:hypothetical protein